MAQDLQLLDGRALAQKKQQSIAKTWHTHYATHTPPRLAVIQVGNLHASTVYVKRKIKACLALNFHADHLQLPDTITQDALLQTIHQLNQDACVTGILVQLPLPNHLCPRKTLSAIQPNKDVDGLHPTNLGRLIAGNAHILPCTTAAILDLIALSAHDLSGATITMVGASTLVGKPTAIALSNRHATVTICNSRTKNLADAVKQAEILIVAIGNPNVIQPDWIRHGSTVIDVGINRGPTGDIIGDVAHLDLSNKVAHITPVPGGVGPMTVANLVANLFTLFRYQQDPIYRPND